MNRCGLLHDAVVVGGGVVGACCALLLASRRLNVALVEAVRPAPWDAAHPDLRVYALAPDNAALLDGLAVWASICAARAQPYQQMRVWDVGGGDELKFAADRLARTELGWIVEMNLLTDRLWAALPAAGVKIHCPARVEALEQDVACARLRLDDGTWLAARIAIAADGASSSLRTLAGIAVDSSCYAQRGVVGYVRSESPHAATAWQRFLPTGPLALLPCPGNGHVLSMVWTLPDHEASRVVALEDAVFARELTVASAARLGRLHPVSARGAFPLRRQLAQTQHRGRVLVLGDAAHVVHPLAGQGVNLGLRDVSALGASVDTARKRQLAWDSPQRLARWARTRRSENAVAAWTFDRINRVFSNDDVLPTVLRGPVLGLTGRIPGVSAWLARQALDG